MSTELVTESSQTPSINEVQAYWDRRPCNIRHSPAPLGTREYFDQVEMRKYFVEPHIPGFAEFDRWKGKKVLEIGCGIGTDAVNFARAGANYTGIELSQKSMEIAQGRFRQFGLSGRFISGNAEDLYKLVPNERFDLIYSFGVIHHSPETEKIVSQFKDLLAPDGEVRLMLYSRYSWKSLMIALGFDQPEAQSGCPIAKVYSYAQVRQLLSDFKSIQLRKDHIFPYIIEKYVQYQYEVVPWFRWMPKPLFRCLEKTLGWHTLITCKHG